MATSIANSATSQQPLVRQQVSENLWNWKTLDWRRVSLIVLTVFVTQLSVEAQAFQVNGGNSSSQFVRSSSPLPEGGTIMSQQNRGQNVQTVTMIASLPNVPQAKPMTPTVGFQPHPQQRFVANPGLGSAPQGQTTPAITLPSSVPNWENTVAQQYHYPVQQIQPTNTLGFPPIGQPNQIPTTFTPDNLQAPPTIVGSPNPDFNNTGQGNPAFNNQPIVQSPVMTPPQILGGPSVNQAQPWLAPTPSNGLPFSANRQSFSPVLSLRNMPPGSYLGQGWLGQPKAYVDGEPVRNLFRYILP